MSGSALKNVIYVLNEHKKTLTAIAAGAVGVTYAEKHGHVKKELDAQGIRYGEFQGHLSQVPDGHHGWHA